MRGRTCAVALVLLGSWSAAPAVQAVELAFGIAGRIDVHADLGACAELTFRRPGLAVGSFTAAGAVTGPGTATAPVRGATPVVATGTSWFGCLPDAYAGATAGVATYQLAVSSADGDFVAALSCVVRAGVVTCR